MSVIVARLADLSARRRDLSVMSPNGARRRCPTAGCQTPNGRSDDEYDSIPRYGSRNTSCTRPPVRLDSPRDLSRTSLSMTRSHAPTAVGTSPTGLSGAPGRPRVRARRRAVGPTRRLCIVYTRYKVLGPIGWSREVLRGVSTVRKISVPSRGPGRERG